ncbi:MAG TPA: PepSY-associated TM helix domain-containing protein [Oxalicibacterium sp.]|nr:PepSY-associated TM helix domain-containing protein [Oxalicibacterium sp.]
MKRTIDTSVLARRRSLFWRIHFWAALVASPFALLAALTGILYLFSPQIEQHLYAGLDRVQPRGERLALDAVVDAARKAMPQGAMLSAVFPAWRQDVSVRVLFIPPRPASAMQGHAMHAHAMHGAQPTAPASPWLADAIGTTVYVDPYSARVLGTQAANVRFSAWSKKLHSSLLQGDGWRWMIELGASCLMVMLLTGIYLWWPRGAQSGLPQKGASGRTAWSQWHAFIGVALSIISFVMLTTGLTWSKYAGTQIRVARDAVGQQPPQAPRDLASIVIEGKAPLSWQQAAAAAGSLAPDVALRLMPPSGARGAWRVASANQTRPTKRVDMVMDAYSGKPLFYADWKAQTVFSKATGIGIPFHRGEFGWWNQLLLLLFGAGIVFSLVSGWVMFFKRRKMGMPALPKLLPGAWRSLPPAAWIVAALLCVAMPLLACSAALLAIVEWRLHRSTVA